MNRRRLEVELSVIVPLYNCLPLTQAMLTSLQATLPAGLEHEIILVDDGSTDGTRSWIARLKPPFRVVLNERNLGYGAANNRGAALAQGRWLALLNNDLVLTAGWLEPMLAAHRQLGARAGLIGNVQEDARTGAVDHAGIVINHKGKPEHLRRLPAFSGRFAPVRSVDAVTGACVLVDRWLWRQLGGFDEIYTNGCEDIDLCLRAASAGRVNAIALHSRIRHHVSTSPGRKTRDEANTRLLTQRWRETLALLGLHAWCRHQFEAYVFDPRDVTDPAFALQLLAYLLSLRRQPPAAAREGLRQAIDRELARWKELLEPSAQDLASAKASSQRVQ